MKDFNKIAETVHREDDSFYAARGVLIHSLEVSGYRCAEASTALILEPARDLAEQVAGCVARSRVISMRSIPRPRCKMAMRSSPCARGCLVDKMGRGHVIICIGVT